MAGAPPPSYDELFDALAARQRRNLLRVLEDRNGPTPLSELASELCSVEEAADEGLEDPEERAMRVRIHHVHAPKLAAAGLVEFDHERGVVAPTNRIDRAAAVLDWAADFPRGQA